LNLEKDSLEAPKRKVQKKNIIEDDDALFNDQIGNILQAFLFHSKSNLCAEIVKPKEGKKEAKESYGD
jgi:hypothetical protein